MSISEFIRQLERDRVANSSTSRWSCEFRQAGYFPAELTMRGCITNWQAAHNWCKTEIGEDHYSWTGSVFWFEREEHAVMFILKWS